MGRSCELADVRDATAAAAGVQLECRGEFTVRGLDRLLAWFHPRRRDQRHVRVVAASFIADSVPPESDLA